MTSVWIMFQDNNEAPEEDLGVGGIFTSRKLARAACMNTFDQIWEEELDVILPREDSYADYIEFPCWGENGLYALSNGLDITFYDMGTHEVVEHED